MEQIIPNNPSKKVNNFGLLIFEREKNQNPLKKETVSQLLQNTSRQPSHGELGISKYSGTQSTFTVKN